MDHIGFAMAVPGKFMDIKHIAKLVKLRPDDVSSQIKINFSMVLNLLLSHTPDQIKDLLSESFATFMIVKKRRKKGARKPSGDEHKKLWRDFLHHLDFLKETGYVTKDGVLTADGIWASQLRVDQPLMIAEGFRRGIFPESDPALLAAMTTLFVNERESDDRIEKVFKPKTLLAAFYRVQKGLRPFAALMADRGFETRPLFLRPAVVIYAWAVGQPWEKVLAIAEIEEGNLAMLILRTADNLRHIRSLKRIFPEAALTSAMSIDLIMRSPVAMEYDIG
jgi:superfamily II RNA helicase